MAIHGIKVNDVGIQRYIDSVLGKEVRRVEKIGKEVLDDITKDGIDRWYSMVSGNYYDSIKHSRNIKTGKYKQDKKKIYSEIIFEIDKGKYKSFVDTYSISNYSGTEKITPSPTDFVFNLQWNEGIIGLPPIDRNGHSHPHILASEGLGEYLEKEVKSKWNSEMKKRIGGM